jgi:WD40 repeat protein
VSSNGAWSASSADDTLTLSRAASDLRIVARSYVGKINDLAFLPDSSPRWLVTGGEDGLIRLWPLNGEGLADEVCDRLARTLSTESFARLVASTSGRGCPSAR